MDRIQLIQNLIKLKNFRTYLEIGVLHGDVFFSVDCPKKVAVDPEFRFDRKKRLKEFIKGLIKPKVYFIEKTSDDFFKEDAPQLFKKGELDIVLVDGMHEFNHVLNDVFNSLEFLSPNGVIVLHDCNPKSQQEASTFNEWQNEGFKGYWLGDVWKCIPFLIKNRPDLDVFVADCDFGLGIITKRKNFEAKINHTSDRQIFEAMQYKELEMDRASILNLKTEVYLHEYFFK